jgi:hypothetical protein
MCSDDVEIADGFVSRTKDETEAKSVSNNTKNFILRENFVE